jgi:hypothetical protein
MTADASLILKLAEMRWNFMPIRMHLKIIDKQNPQQWIDTWVAPIDFR